MLFRSFSVIASGILTLSTLAAQTGGSYVIDTLIGSDRPVREGILGAAALLNVPGSVVVNGNGEVLFADSNNHVVRKIAANGIITTYAGNAKAGYSGDGGPAAEASFIQPQGLALDAAGNLYISDLAANVVRKVSAGGIVSTVAGTGFPGTKANSANGGKATLAALDRPYALLVDKQGVLYIAEGQTVRKVTTDGLINSISSAQFNNPEGLAMDASGNLYVSVWGDDVIVKVGPGGTATIIAGNLNGGVAGEGIAATSAALSGPQGITIDSTGAILFCDSLNNRIRKIGVDGKIQTVAGSGSAGLNPIGNDPLGLSVYTPVGIAIDAKGLIYWTEAGNHRVRVLNPSNKQVTEIGGVTPVLNSSPILLFNPSATATDSAGNIYIADTDNNVVRRLTPGGVSTVFAGTGNAVFNGDVGTATAINLVRPMGVSVDAQGSVFIADSGTGRVRKVDTTGRMLTVMGSGLGLPLSGTFASNAFLLYPTSVVALGNGAFVVCDQFFGIVATVGSTDVITLASTASAGYLTLPASIAVSDSGLYVADTFAHRILKFTQSALPGGNPYANGKVIAGTGQPGYSGDGGDATRAALYFPNGIALDFNGNLIIADSGNSVIRAVDSAGKIRTIAGSGFPGFSGDKGPAAAAMLSFPSRVSVDTAGNLLVADENNQRIRIVKYVATAPDFTFTSDAPANLPINHGVSATVKLTLTSVGGYSGSIVLSSQASAGLTVQLAPSSVISLSPNQSTSVTANIQAAADAVLGPASITFTAVSASGTHTVAVNLKITNSPQFSAAGVVSAASFGGSAVAPGEIVAIFGQDLGPAGLAPGAFDSSNILTTSVGGTRVLFDGQAAPLIYSLAGQVSAIVPYAVAGKTVTQLQVEYNGVKSASVAISVADAAPAVFNLPSVSQAAALNTDLTLNGAANPAAQGSVVVLFATGEGQTNPAGADGQLATDVFPKPLLPVQVAIGGQLAEVLYSGAAPFEVAGVMQLNVRVPTGLTPGNVPVMLQVGNIPATGASTIAVK